MNPSLSWIHSDATLFDLVRVAAIIMYGLAMGETAFIIKAYGRLIESTRRLLPLHITLISIATLGNEGIIIYGLARAIGNGPTVPAALSVVFVAMTYISLRAMRLHVTRKRDLHQRVSPLLHEKDETP